MAAEEEKADDITHDRSEPLNEKATSRPDVAGYSHGDVDLPITDEETSEAHRAGHSESEDEGDHDHDHDREQEHDPDGEPVRPRSSRASSIFSRSRSVIPRAERRGILGRLAIIPEIERPFDYKNKTKWAITAIIALAAAAAPMGSGIFYRTFSTGIGSC
jgi:hypothetical protein